MRTYDSILVFFTQLYKVALSFACGLHALSFVLAFARGSPYPPSRYESRPNAGCSSRLAPGPTFFRLIKN